MRRAAATQRRLMAQAVALLQAFVQMHELLMGKRRVPLSPAEGVAALLGTNREALQAGPMKLELRLQVGKA